MTLLALGETRDTRYRTLLITARAAVLAFCLPLVLLGAGPAEGVLHLLLLAVVATLASVRVSRPSLARLQPVVEGVLAAVVTTQGTSPHLSLICYLLVPPVAAGLLFGVVPVVLSTGLSVIAASVTFLLFSGSTAFVDFAGTTSQWFLTTLVAGLLAAWVRRVQADVAPDAAENESYLAAYRLVGQLRTVSRQLSGGLDSVSIAQALLQDLRDRVPFDVGAIFARSAGGALLPLAVEGADQVEWQVSAEPDTLVGDAWLSQEPQVGSTSVAGSTGTWSAALPLRMGVRSVGVLLLEGRTPFEVSSLRQAMPDVDSAALRLETALLFDEVRSIATVEERRRVAREIHDGVAQELASLGYAVDSLTADARPGQDAGALEEGLRALRKEVGRLVTELRLSIFDLRSEVQHAAGLGSALSDYVRQVGAQSGLTVHLSLDEVPQRLRADVEAELLRIAQEAVTNARRHANARNLWVSCTVAPPSARLVIEDDGLGLGVPRSDSFGMEIMRERSARIGAQLQVRARDGGGTAVEVTLEPAATVATPRLLTG